MKTGYDQFFKNARNAPKTEQPRKPMPKISAELTRRTLPKKQVTSNTANKEMAEELRKRIRNNSNFSSPAKVLRAKKSKFPWKLAVSSLMGLGLTLFGMQNLEKFESYAKNVEITLFGQAYAKETPAPKKDVKKDEKAAAANAASAEPEKKKAFTTEEIDHFAKLNERKKELDAREAELTRVESEIAAQKIDLEKRLQELETTRKNISQVLEEKVRGDDKKVETLVQMYSSMKPQQAAKVFEAMDEDLAVEIMGRMKKKSAAEVMNLMKAEKAQVFSEKFAGYRRK